MKQLTILTMGSLIVALGFTMGIVETDAASSEEQEIVNCPDDSIQEELDDADEPTTIFVTGTCVEDVTITKDDITLSGNQSGTEPGPGGAGTIIGNIEVRGGHRVVIEGLTVTGPGNGIDATDGATVTIIDNIISDNLGSGIFANNAAFVSAEHNVIANNNMGASPGVGSGIEIGLGAVVRARGNTITDNNFAGVCVFDHGTYRGHLETIVALSSGAGFPQAVEMSRNSFARLQEVDVTGDISVGRQSALELRGPSTVSGTVFVNTMSLLRRAGSISGSLTVVCDTTSLCLP